MHVKFATFALPSTTVQAQPSFHVAHIACPAPSPDPPVPPPPLPPAPDAPLVKEADDDGESSISEDEQPITSALRRRLEREAKSKLHLNDPLA